MSTRTKNYNLVKPDPTDPADTTATNGNWDIVDQHLADRANKTHKHDASDIASGTLPIARGGMGSNNGADGLKNLLAAGNTILSSHQYGDSLPSSAPAGRIFFKKVT